MKYAYLLAAGLLSACASNAPAPVVERNASVVEVLPGKAQTQAPAAASGGDWYTVKKGDTLYSIALEHSRDYRDVATWNNLDNPDRIRVGQQLRLNAPQGEEPVAVAKPVLLNSSPTQAQPVATAATAASVNTDTFKREPKGGVVPYSEAALAKMREGSQAAQQPVAKTEEKAVPAPEAKPAPAGDDAVDWMWPAPGKASGTFSESGPGANKGIDIGGKIGDPVFAAAAGKVVYVGSGLRGYGNLVIVRHNGSYLSAYAHNSKILVKETQSVTKGQKIAEIGNSDADQAGLHFEIRRQGKPVDPLNYLPAR